MTRTVHVIGAGLAGLSAAVTLADQGHAIRLYEAGAAAGGRCRSYHDQALNLRIDNGNHLLLSGNHAAFAFLDRLGSRGTLVMPDAPVFPFYEVDCGQRWALRPSRGRLPLWLLDRDARVPATRLADYLRLGTLAFARPETTLDQALRPGPLRDKLIGPIAISALNTPLDQASAQLFFAVMRETLLAGGQAIIPAFPAQGLSASFVDPALALLDGRGAQIRLSTRVHALRIAGGRVTGISLPEGEQDLGEADAVVLAVPPNVASALLPGIAAPDQFESILNIHYRIDAAGPQGLAQAQAMAGQAGFIGLLGGLAEWVFLKPPVASITLSAANRLIADDADQLAARIWPEVRAALGLAAGMALPVHRVVKEKRATFAATPAMAARRAAVGDGPANLALAGDWTATGLPATIEGAIRSGQAAARHIAAR